MKSVPWQRYRFSPPFLYLAEHPFQGVTGLFLLNPKQNLTNIQKYERPSTLSILALGSYETFPVPTFSGRFFYECHTGPPYPCTKPAGTDRHGPFRSDGHEHVLNTLEKSTGVDFVYSSKAIGAHRKLSVHQNNQKLAFVLEATLKPMNIGFRLVESSILLHRSVVFPAGRWRPVEFRWCSSGTCCSGYNGHGYYLRTKKERAYYRCERGGQRLRSVERLPPPIAHTASAWLRIAI